MFRRKEESLFDNTTDPNQEPVESATVTSSPSSQSAPVSAPSHQSAGSSSGSGSPSSASSSYGHSSMPRPPGAAAAPAHAQPASAFRSPPPPSPLSGDMARNRMPEVGKSSSSSGILPASNQQAVASPEKGNKTGARRVLTVGNDILLKGEIATCDRLVIEGKVDATLNDVHTVEIAENGSFKGSANIEDAEISGLFEGDLVVRNRLVIYATGKVRGKITYGEIEIERGGELTGEIKTNASSGSSSTSPRSRQTKDDKVAA